MSDLTLATHAALEAGKLLREKFGQLAVVDEATHHDIKLQLDKTSQDLITKSCSMPVLAMPSMARKGSREIRPRSASGSSIPSMGR